MDISVVTVYLAIAYAYSLANATITWVICLLSEYFLTWLYIFLNTSPLISSLLNNKLSKSKRNREKERKRDRENKNSQTRLLIY